MPSLLSDCKGQVQFDGTGRRHLTVFGSRLNRYAIACDSGPNALLSVHFNPPVSLTDIPCSIWTVFAA